MKILALDTSTMTASVAVTVDGRVAAAHEDRVTTHSERLLPLVEEVLAAAGLDAAAIDAVACGAGPGSFTGLRIGFATAKGLAFALGKPLYAVSSLAALAVLAAPAAAARGAEILAILDARRREVYAGLYRLDAAGLPAPAAAEVVIAPDRLAAELPPGPRVVVGDGALAYPEAAARMGAVLADLRPTPSAIAVAKLAEARGTPDDLLAAGPSYIRASEAELKWRE